MNWIIRSTKTVRFHTNIKEVLKPIWEDLKEYNWVIADLDFMSDTEIPVNLNTDYFILKYHEFEKIYKSDAQIIWGIVSAVPKNCDLNLSIISTLSAEDENVWKCDQFLISESFVEIVAFDSGYTILKFMNQQLSNKFKNYFGKKQ